MRLREEDLGTEIECTRCGASILTSPQNTQRLPSHSLGRGRDRDRSSAAIWSLVLGISAVFTSPCCGFGGFLGLPGFFLGISGLNSRQRGVSILGMLASLFGMIASIGIIVFFILGTAQQLETVPAKPDGTRAPFAP
jgi:hypothetical protein